jgi:hypothetical protein
MIVILIAASAYYVGRRLGSPRTALASGWFVFGAFCSSLSFYARQIQGAGDAAAGRTSIQEIAVLEWTAVSVLGVLTIVTSAYLARKYFSHR